jgi:hypothetical protein
MSADHCPTCPFTKPACDDCPAPGGDPQGTLISAGGDGYSGRIFGRIGDVSDPRERLTPGVWPETYVRGPDMATIPPTTPNAHPAGGDSDGA